MAGRNKIPDAMKKLHGTDQKCRMSGNGNNLEVYQKLPPPPKWINEIGKKLYRKIGKDILASGLINFMTINSFCIYCHEMGNYIKLESEILVEGPIVIMTISTAKSEIEKPIKNPKIDISKQSLNYAVALAKEFGFTPVSQMKIALAITGKSEEDEYEKFRGQ